MLGKINLGISVVLAAVVVWSVSSGKSTKSNVADLQAQLALAQQELAKANQALAGYQQGQEKVSKEISQLNGTVMKVAGNSDAVSKRLKAYEDQAKQVLLAQKQKAAEEAQLAGIKKEVKAPVVTVETTKSGQTRRKVVFPELLAKDGKALLKDAEFSDIYGSKLVFRETTGARQSFSVTELHPGVLEHLGVNAAAAIRDQAEQEQFRKDLRENMAKLYQAKVKEDQMMVVRKARMAELRRQQQTKEQAEMAAIEVERTLAEAERARAQAEVEKSRAEQMLPAMLRGIGDFLNNQGGASQ